MSLKATIYKAQLNVADINRHYYQSHHLTVAKHPSESVQRMMLRLTIFALNASDTLTFTKGISTDSEPDIWQKNLINGIELWIDIGQLTEDRIRKACHQSEHVVIYSYKGNSTQPWWEKVAAKLERFNNLSIYRIDCDDFELLLQRSMQLQYTIEDSMVYVSDNKHSIECTLTKLL